MRGRQWGKMLPVNFLEALLVLTERDTSSCDTHSWLFRVYRLSQPIHILLPVTDSQLVFFNLLLDLHLTS
jgi:hypothetical protein